MPEPSASESRPKVGQQSDAADMDDQITPALAAVSTYVMRMMELSGVLCTLTKIIEASPSDVVLGIKLTYSDVICEALHRMIERKTYMVIERELIPGERASIERLKVDQLKYDIPFLRELLEFKKTNTVLVNDEGVDEIIADLLGLRLGGEGTGVSTLAFADTSAAEDEVPDETEWGR